MKRTLAYLTDIAIGVEANPYNHMIMPGKETEIAAPMWLLTLRASQKILEEENLLSAQVKVEFQNIITKIERLRKGEVIGKPRQRRLLAR